MRFLLSLLFVTTAFAQTAVYPGNVVTDGQLFRGINALQNALALGVASTDTSIQLNSTIGVVVPSLMTIDSEIVAVCGLSGNTLRIGKSSCPNIDGRGFDGTQAVGHAAGHAASWFVDAWHHNALSKEIEAIETALGANLSNVITAGSQQPHTVYAGPQAGITPATPSFRTLVTSDIPTGYAYASLSGVPTSFNPTAHAVTHQFGGSDPVATATPSANAIPMAGGGGKLAAGWLPFPSLSTIGGVEAVDCTATSQLVGKINTDGTITCSTASAGGLVSGPGAVTNGFVPQWNGTNSLGTGIAVSATPGANTIVESNGSGKLAAGWLPNPSNSTLGGVQSLAAVTHQFLTQISTSGVVSAAQPSFSDLSGSIAPGQIPNPSPTTLGGVESFAAVTHQFLTQISTSGVVSAAQPAFTDISGTVAAAQLPNPGASSLGGVQSFAPVSNQFLTGISTSGVVSAAQPAFTNLSGSLQSSQLPALTGDATTSGFAITFATVNGGPGACGDSTHVCQIVTNGKGLVTSQTAVGISGSAFGNQTANTIFAGPTTGSPATPTFRALVSADIPNNAANTSGTAGGITGYTFSGSGTILMVGTGSFTNGNCLAMGASGNVVDNGTPCGSGGGGGTVTSVGLSLPGIFSVSGSPVTTTGTLTATLATQSANLVWASATSGGAATPTFRALVGADLPNPSSSTLGGIQSFAGVSSQWIRSISTAGVPAASQPAFTDISGTVAAAQLPNPTSSTLGGIRSFAAVTHQWINTISTSGVPSSTQPAFSDISGLVDPTQLPLPGVGTLGGVTAFTPSAHFFLTGLSNLGGLSAAQPAIADLSDGANVATVAGTQSLLNKTLYFSTLGGLGSAAPLTQTYVNSGSPGTTNKKLAKMVGNFSLQTITTADTDALGVVVSGGGVAGFVEVGILGIVTCTFDNAQTAGHYVQISTTVAGDCHDAGASMPTTGGTVLGVVVQSGGTGDQIMQLRMLTPLGGGGGGAVSSVGLSLPGSVFSVSGSPVTSSGTLTASFLNESANTVFAGPSSGGATTPTFRTLVTADIPTGYPYANLSGAPTLFYQTLQSNTSGVTQRSAINFGPEFTLTDNASPSRTTVSLTKSFTGTGSQIATATGTFTSGHVAAWDAAGNIIDGGAISGTGTVTNVSFTGGVISVANPTTTPSLTIAGNSGGIPYFTSGSTWASSSALGANLPVFGGGPGASPFTGTRTGNTTQLATWSGATTASRCVHTDGSGNLTVAGADCGSGGGGGYGSLGDFFAVGDGVTNSFTPGWTFASSLMEVFLGGLKQRGAGNDFTASVNGVSTGVYISGISVSGTAGQTCFLNAFNGGGTGATAVVTLTGTNTIASGVALVISGAGSGYLANPTTAGVSTGTAALCGGTANITTTTGNTIQFTNVPVSGAVIEVIQ